VKQRIIIFYNQSSNGVVKNANQMRRINLSNANPCQIARPVFGYGIISSKNAHLFFSNGDPVIL